MGAVCCVSARGATTSEGANGEILRINCPSWGGRRVKRPIATWEESAESLIADLRRNRMLRVAEENLEPNPQKLPLSKESASTQSKTQISVSAESPEPKSMSSPESKSMSSEVNEIVQTPATPHQTLLTLPVTPSASYLSTSPLLPKSNLPRATSSPLKWSPRIPKSNLFRQGSDGQICRLESPSNHSVTEVRSSPLLHLSSIASGGGSHGGSVDGWTVQSFPDNTTSTHRETWSFDRDSLSHRSHTSHQSHTLGSDSQMSDSHSKQLEACVVCSKNVDVYVVVAILVCGHVYHADCLEHLTPEISKYDPVCPICTYGEKKAMKMFEKLRKELNVDFVPWSQCGNRAMLVSKSGRRNSFAKPFLKRHFSFSSMAGSSSSSENQPAKARSLLWSKSSK